MRRTTTALFALALIALAVVPALVAAAEDAPGKQAFISAKCNMCHSVPAAGIEAKVKSEKMKGPDLVDVGKSHDDAWLTQWLHKKVEMDGKLHPAEFKGTDEELKALIDWIKEQK